MPRPSSREAAVRALATSFIVSTYESPDALDCVLRALSEQSDQTFEVVIADDGSGAATAATVEEHQTRFGGRLVHVHQADMGFRKARVLNLAGRTARGDYLVFIDGDCMPRIGCLEAIHRAALPQWFLASKRVHMSERLSRRVVEERVPVWRWSAFRWLAVHPHEVFAGGVRHTNRPGVLVSIRDRRRPWRPHQPDFAAPYGGYGFFLGVSREDFERVNGFDMRYEGWGGEDRDMAVRLQRSGLRCGWPGPGATMLHLWHEAPTPRSRANAELMTETQRSDRSRALVGLAELDETTR